MGSKRGGIYLANFNPSKGTEPGKFRPCLIVQSDLLNEGDHPCTTVILPTSQLIYNAAPLRLRITARDKLGSDSNVRIDQTSTIDNTRITSGALTVLTDKEIVEVKEYLKIALGLTS